MKTGGIVALILFGATSIANSQQSPQDNHLIKLLQANFICNQKTQESVLSHNDALDCIEIYNRLKIRLLNNLTYSEYEKLTNSEKRKANRKGYMAYLNWIEHNQELASKLERNAKIILSQNPNFWVPGLSWAQSNSALNSEHPPELTIRSKADGTG